MVISCHRIEKFSQIYFFMIILIRMNCIHYYFCPSQKQHLVSSKIMTIVVHWTALNMDMTLFYWVINVVSNYLNWARNNLWLEIKSTTANTEISEEPPLNCMIVKLLRVKGRCADGCGDNIIICIAYFIILYNFVAHYHFRFFNQKHIEKLKFFLHKFPTLWA